MRRIALCLSLLILAGCAATPPACRSEAARELRALDRVIAETRANVDRGYAVGSGRGGMGFDFCIGGGGDHVGVSLCAPGGDRGWRRGPHAIDIEAERRKLAALEAHRRDLLRRARAEIAACEAARG